MIAIANIRTYRPGSSPDAYEYYAGRPMSSLAAFPLANPFKLSPGESRESCLAKYRTWLENSPSRSPQQRELQRLAAIAREQEIVLLCWCAPELCHAEVIREQIERITGLALTPEMPGVAVEGGAR